MEWFLSFGVEKTLATLLGKPMEGESVSPDLSTMDIDTLTALLKSDQPRLQGAAIREVAKRGAHDLLPELARKFWQQDLDSRCRGTYPTATNYAAARALHDLATPDDVPLLREILQGLIKYDPHWGQPLWEEFVATRSVVATQR